LHYIYNAENCKAHARYVMATSYPLHLLPANPLESVLRSPKFQAECLPAQNVCNVGCVSLSAYIKEAASEVSDTRVDITGLGHRDETTPIAQILYTQTDRRVFSEDYIDTQTAGPAA